MASMKVEKEIIAAAAEVDLDLATVKELTQQVWSFGFDDAVEDPIFQWRLENNWKHLTAKPYSSDLFPINRSDLIGQLNLKYTNDLNLSLKLLDEEKIEDEKINTLRPFQFFICKYKLYFRNNLGSSIEKCYFSMNAFDLLGGNKSELNFKFHYCDAFAITVELYQEPLAMIDYRSPYNNTVVGKIENFNGMKEETDYQQVRSVSPRFSFGSTDQLMIVRFWYSTKSDASTASGLSATLHILSQSEPRRGPPFSFAAIFTIFSPKATVKDLVIKIFFRRDENQSDYPIFLAFPHELATYLENDTLYYKVVIEPRLSLTKIKT